MYAEQSFGFERADGRVLTGKTGAGAGLFTYPPGTFMLCC
jgi:hypothetical protein